MGLPIITSPRTESQLRSALSRIEQVLADLVAGGGGSGTGFTQTGTAGGTVTANDVVYPSAANEVSRARANASATAKVAGIALESGVAGDAIRYQLSGIVVGFSGLTTNTYYYLSAVTPGALVATPDATTGQYIVPVGLSISTTALLLRPWPRVLL